MYQSIPKRVYTTQESAMPKMPLSASFSAEEQNCHPTKSETKIANKMQMDDLLLIGLLLLLISEEGENELLIAVVAFLLFF